MFSQIVHTPKLKVLSEQNAWKGDAPSAKALLGASVTYSEFDRMGVQQLRDALNDALSLM